MEFIAYSPLAIKSVIDFTTHIKQKTAVEGLLYQRIQHSPCKVLVIALDAPDINDLDGPSVCIVNMLFKAWQCIVHSPPKSMKTELAWEQIKQIAEPLWQYPYVDEEQPQKIYYGGLVRFKDKTLPFQYSILLKDTNSYSIPAYYVNVLANICQIELGKFPLHSSAIINNTGLFLFSGKSGTGKSTIATLSKMYGYDVLDDDLVLIRRQGNHGFTADAWGRDIKGCNVLLKAIIFPIQSTAEILKPLPRLKLIQLLLERYNDIAGDFPTNSITALLLNSATEIAQIIPGYELHFRKSPDFWKLIDERFPG